MYAFFPSTDLLLVVRMAVASCVLVECNSVLQQVQQACFGADLRLRLQQYARHHDGRSFDSHT